MKEQESPTVILKKDLDKETLEHMPEWFRIIRNAYR